jgi:hypothetical protein
MHILFEEKDLLPTAANKMIDELDLSDVKPYAEVSKRAIRRADFVGIQRGHLIAVIKDRKSMPGVVNLNMIAAQH